jgi:nucleotide-binding universal stress UspA family protein
MLVAYDGTEGARNALGVALELAKALGADIALISVIPDHPGWTSTNPCDDDSIHALQLCEAQEIVRRSGLEPTLLERTGEPAETIERVAQEGNYDLLVVGSRGPENKTGAHMGTSVSEHVAAHAPMTVVVARQSGDHQTASKRVE